MQRGVRPMTHEYNGARVTFGMPGWYCDTCGKGVYTSEDLKVSDRALDHLKVMRAGYRG